MTGLKVDPRSQLATDLTAGNDALKPSQANLAAVNDWQSKLQTQLKTWSDLTFDDIDTLATEILKIRTDAHTANIQVAITDSNKNVNEILKYVVLKKYYAEKSKDGFDFKAFQDEILGKQEESKKNENPGKKTNPNPNEIIGKKTELNRALEKLPNAIRIKETAIEDTLAYLEKMEKNEKSLGLSFQAQKDDLLSRIGDAEIPAKDPSKYLPEKSASGHIARCDQQLKKVEARLGQLPQDITSLNNAITQTAGDSKSKARQKDLAKQKTNRQNEQKALEKLRTELTGFRTQLLKQRETLTHLENPQMLPKHQKDIEDTLDKVDHLTLPVQEENSQKANLVISAHQEKRLTQVIDATKKELDPDPKKASNIFGLPSLGKDLKDYDYELHDAIESVNEDLKALKQIDAALTANPGDLALTATNPGSKVLQNESSDRLEKLQENLNHLTAELKKYDNTMYLLSQRQNFDLFQKRLFALQEAQPRNLLQKVRHPLKGDIILSDDQKKEFENTFAKSTQKNDILVYGRTGKKELYTDQSGKSLDISDKAFDTAMAKFIAEGGKVEKTNLTKLKSLFGGKPTYSYRFKPGGKEHFLQLVTAEAKKEKDGARKDRDRPEQQASVRVEPGNHTEEKENRNTPSA